VAALILLGAVAYKFLFPSDEARIRKQLDGLAKALSFSGSEGGWAALASINKLRDTFVSEVVVDLSGVAPGQEIIRGREEIIQLAQAARSRLRNLQVRFVDVEVTLASDRQSAATQLAVLADVNAEKNSVAQILKLNWAKIDRRWLITRVEPVKALGR
jgi:hypothetical protein